MSDSSPISPFQNNDKFYERLGDLSLILSWQFIDDLSLSDTLVQTVRSMTVFYNDDSEITGSVGWYKKDLTLVNITSRLVYIELPQEFINKRVAYYISVDLLGNINDLNSVYTYNTDYKITGGVVITSPTVSLDLTNYDGRSTLLGEENVYYVNISNYDESFGPVSFSIIKKVHNSVTRVNAPSMLPLAISDNSLNQFDLPLAPSNSRFFRVTNIIPDTIHELSSYYKINNLFSPLSPTTYINNTKKLLLSTEQNKGPSLSFDNVNGMVTFSTYFNRFNKEKSPESTLELLLFLIQKDDNGDYIIPDTPTVFRTMDILPLLYDQNSNPVDPSLNEYVKKSNFDYLSAIIDISGDNSESINQHLLEYNKRYKLAGATKTDGLSHTTLVLTPSLTDFCIQKTPLEPTINNCYLDQSFNQLIVDWSDGLMFNNTVERYSLRITDVNGLEISNLSPALSGRTAKYDASGSFQTGSEYKVFVKTQVLDLNQNDGSLLGSQWSTPVTFTYYRKSDFGTLTLLVDKTISNVNKQAILSWNPPATSDLPITKFLLYRDGVFHRERSNISTSYTDEQLINGVSYRYVLELVLTVKEFRTTEVNKTETITSSHIDFIPWKVPEKPIIDNCHLNQSLNQLMVDWSDGFMFNTNVYSYSLRITDVNGVEISNLSPTLLGRTATYDASGSFQTGSEYKVFVKTHVEDLNPNDGSLLGSQWSTPVTFTYYRKSDFGTLTLLVDKTISNVNKQAILSWNIPATSDLSITKFLLYRDGFFHQEIINSSTSYPDEQLSNGVSYRYVLELVLTVKEFRTTEVNKNEKITSLHIDFIPWELPEKPALSLSNWSNNVGNRYVDLNVRAYDDYMKTRVHGHNIYYKLSTDSTYTNNSSSITTSYNFNVRISNLLNETLHNFKAITIYKDPNDTSITHQTVDSVVLDATPTAISNDYAPTTITFSDIGSRTVTLNWNKPVLADENAIRVDDSIVGDNRVFRFYQIGVYEKNSNNSYSKIDTLNNDGNDSSLNSSNNLEYTINNLINGNSYKFSVYACYATEEDSNLIIKNEYLSSAVIKPFTTYPVDNLSILSKDYNNGDITISFDYSLNNNNNSNYLDRLEIYVNTQKRYTIHNGSVSTSGSTTQLLENQYLNSTESSNSIIVKSIFRNPNTTVDANANDSSSLSAISYKHPSDNFNFRGTDVTDQGVVLSWVFPLSSVNYSTLNYNISRYIGSSATEDNVSNDINRLITTTNVTGLSNHQTYTFKIKTTFIDTDDNSVRSKPCPEIVTIRTRSPIGMVDITSYTALNSSVNLNFDTPLIFNGLNASNYKIHYRSITDPSSVLYTDIILDDMPSADVTNDGYIVRNLTNGVTYSFYYSGELDNSENKEEDQNKTLIFESNRIDLTPFKQSGEVSDLAINNHASGLNITLNWSHVPPEELGGSTLQGYQLSKRQGSGVWTVVNSTLTLDNNILYTATAEDYGSEYEFSIKVFTTNLNDGTSLSSNMSNVVSHIFFEAPKSVSVTDDEFLLNTTTNNYFVRLKIDYDESIGLIDPSFEVILDSSTEYQRTFEFSPSRDLDGKCYIILSDLSANIINRAEVRVIGLNPNNNLELNSIWSVTKEIEFYDKPLLKNGSVVAEAKNLSVLVKINETGSLLEKNNGNFQYYEVKLTYSNNIVRYENTIIAESIDDLMIYNLTNNITYTLTVTAVCLSPRTGSSLLLYGNVISTTVTPYATNDSAGSVPDITSAVVSNNRLTFTVDTKGSPLLGWYLFWQYNNLDFTAKAKNNQFFYRSPPEQVTSIKPVKIIIDVLKHLNQNTLTGPEGIQYSFSAYNQYGRTDFNSPITIYDPNTHTGGNYVMYLNNNMLYNSNVLTEQ